MAKKGTRQWGATGVGYPTTPYLSADARQQIEQFFKDLNVRVSNPDAFFDTLANAIGFFKENVKLREKSRPAAVRENLRLALARALALNDALNKLDGNSRRLLGEVAQGRIDSIFGNIQTVILVLNKARTLADDYPSAGNLPEPHRLFLAVDVADAIETFLGAPVTTTKTGLFVAILEVALTVATGKEAKAVHELARKAIKYKYKVKRNGQGGLIEYVPPPKT